jgi:hypothetical protein
VVAPSGLRPFKRSVSAVLSCFSHTYSLTESRRVLHIAGISAPRLGSMVREDEVSRARLLYSISSIWHFSGW